MIFTRLTSMKKKVDFRGLIRMWLISLGLIISSFIWSEYDRYSFLPSIVFFLGIVFGFVPLLELSILLPEKWSNVIFRLIGIIFLIPFVLVWGSVVFIMPYLPGPHPPLNLDLIIIPGPIVRLLLIALQVYILYQGYDWIRDLIKAKKSRKNSNRYTE